MPAFLLIVFVLSAGGSGAALSADSLQSPVFRTYRRPSSSPVLPQSDATWQIWQAFMATRRANAGDPVAQHELGLRYLVGRGVDPDTQRAAYWIERAALQGLPTAELNAGILFLNGMGVSWNPFTAFRFVERAAASGVPEARYLLGFLYTENLIVPRDLVRALGLFRSSADSGFAPAEKAHADLRVYMERMADRSSDSREERPAMGAFILTQDDTLDPGQDVSLLQAALRKADPALLRALGIGRGAHEDLPERHDTTLALISDAASAGSPEALVMLGRMHEKGLVWRRDRVRAALMYLQALRFESSSAWEMFSNLQAEQGFWSEVKRRAVDGGADAKTVWATALAVGLEGMLVRGEVYLTPQQALGLLREAAADGNGPAMVELGLNEYAGRWSPRSLDNAVVHWRRAEAQGEAIAAIRLAVLAVRGEAPTMELSTAVDVLSRGAEAGGVLAAVGLAYCLERGIGIRQDPGRAAEFYRGAASRGSSDAFQALRRLHDQLRPPDPRFVVEDRL